jgi:hypothetical protein
MRIMGVRSSPQELRVVIEGERKESLQYVEDYFKNITGYSYEYIGEGARVTDRRQGESFDLIPGRTFEFCDEKGIGVENGTLPKSAWKKLWRNGVVSFRGNCVGRGSWENNQELELSGVSGGFYFAGKEYEVVSFTNSFYDGANGNVTFVDIRPVEGTLGNSFTLEKIADRIKAQVTTPETSIIADRSVAEN